MARTLVDLRSSSVVERPRSAAEWSRGLSRAYVPCAVRPGPISPRGAIQSLAVHDLEIVHLSVGPLAVTREERSISSSDRDCFALLMPLRGRELIFTSGGAAQIRPGDGVLWRFGQPASFESATGLTKIGLIVSAPLIQELCPALRVGYSLFEETPALRVLGSYLDVLLGSATGLDASSQAAARNAALELLRAVLHAHSPGDREVHALHAVIVRWLDGNLTAELSPSTVAAAHGISVRTLHRVFADHDETFSETVRNRRLARARKDIVSGCGTFSDIAHRWGFSDGSHFTRRFRERYGVTPREARHSVGDAAG